jgi:Golgi nucleoside diphosphatase
MGKKDYQYGLVFDAGSSGTRVYVYSWLKASSAREKADEDELERLPDIKTKKKWVKKVHPGISTFGETPELVGSEHLKELVGFALDIVPKKEVENTPVFLLATAGMRLLPSDQRSAVLSHVCSYFQQNTDFFLPDCDAHVQVIPGETEGLYGWIAANYLLGGFDSPEEHDHGKGHHTYGFLDMGGASAQIAFAPNATEAEKHANDLKLLRLRKVDGTALEYQVFVTTWLGFGANEARRRYVTQLLEASPDAHELPDPCLPVGILIKTTGEEIEPGSEDLLDGKEPHLVGTGDFTECLRRTYPLLEKEKACTDEPCLLNGVHTPAIDFAVNHFVGVSEYWHTTHQIFAMAHKDKAYDFQTYQKQVTEFCSQDWKSIEQDVADEKWGHKVDEKTVEEVCFKASWLISMLHEGIGVPRVGIEASGGNGSNTDQVIEKAKDRGFLDPFQAVDEIDGKEVSWTLGKIVLYASSQMPAAAVAMAVGFGSNIKGNALPPDFQFPSGARLTSNATSPASSTPATSPASSSPADDDWHDRILASSYSRQIPGILIFLLILVLAVYLYCGRERRLSLWHKFTGGRKSQLRKSGGGGTFPSLSSKFFGNSHSPSYDRVLEEGDPDDFELAPYTSHSSSSSIDGDVGGHLTQSNLSVTTPLDHAVRTGRTSGLATPGTRGLSPDHLRNNSPKLKGGYFDHSSIHPTAAAGATPDALGISAFERGGLLSRSESREVLTAPGNGVAGQRTRSRRASPARRTSPLTPFKESLE